MKLQDPEYVAKYAREKYLYSKDGELIIKIVDENEQLCYNLFTWGRNGFDRIYFYLIASGC